VRLFERDRRGVRPTAFGELVLARAAALLGGVAELRSELAQLQGLETGELRVGAGLYPAEISVATAIGRLSDRRQGLRISLLNEPWNDIAGALHDGRLDVAVVELSPLENDRGLELELLPYHAARIVCRAGHPLLRQRKPTLSAILEYPIAGTRLPPRVVSSLARASQRPLADETGDYVPPFHVETVAAAKLILASSDAIAFLPQPLVAADLAAGSIVALDYRAPWLRTHYGFAYARSRPPSAAVTAFMAEVHAAEAEARARS
jgi:DNA-binding transcriptional LysR family regulator